MTMHDGSPHDDDPWLVLGLSADASEAEVRAAYLRLVKTYPPDRAPEQFERVRDAYEELRDPRRRGVRLIFGADPEAPLVSLLDGEGARRRFVGPRPWRAALRSE